MAPHATHDISASYEAPVHDVKAKVVVKQLELAVDDPTPVADNFMYDFKYNHELPTTDVLGVRVPDDCDAQAVAERLLSQLARAMQDGNADEFANLFLDYGMTDDGWTRKYNIY